MPVIILALLRQACLLLVDLAPRMTKRFAFGLARPLGIPDPNPRLLQERGEVLTFCVPQLLDRLPGVPVGHTTFFSPQEG